MYGRNKYIWGDSDWMREDPPCFHQWKKTLLIYTAVYDCSECGMKKEDYDEKEKKGKDDDSDNWF